MRKHESNKLNMYSGVVAYLESNADAYSSLPVLTESFNNFKNVVEQIKAIDVDFRSQTKGVTADKLAIENGLITSINKIANALYVLGVKTKNNELMVNSKISKSSLTKLRDNLLANKAEQILNLANANAQALTDYGVTEQMLTDTQNLLNSFNDDIGKQVNQHANAKAKREELSELFDKADATLKDEIDPMIEMFADTNPTFYNGYFAARVIKDLGEGGSSKSQNPPTQPS